MYKMIDSMSFLPSSLDQLVTDLKNKDISKFTQTRSLGGKDSDMLLRKGYFPYEYITDKEKLRDTSLPSFESFFSTLKGQGIKEIEYQHAEEVWRRFKCKTLSDYMRLYCRADVCLLADVWTNFCAAAKKNFDIDPESGKSIPSF